MLSIAHIVIDCADAQTLAAVPRTFTSRIMLTITYASSGESTGTRTGLTQVAAEELGFRGTRHQAGHRDAAVAQLLAQRKRE